MDTLIQNTVASFAQKWAKTQLPFSNTLKAQAQDVLENNSFPTTRMEAWKYTRVTKISKQNFTNKSGEIDDISKYKILKSAPTLVFVNGLYNALLSSDIALEGVTISPLSRAEGLENFGESICLENDVFNALNTLYATDGACIRFGNGKQIDQTIQVLFIQKGEFSHGQIRNKFIAEKGSNGKILMAFFSENAETCFSNCVSEIEVEDNAQLTIDKIQLENETALQIATEQVNQKRDSTFTINTLTLSGLLVRNNLTIAVNGQNCNSHLNGMYLTKGQQHVDNHTVVDHLVPNCESFELYKGVMDENSTAVFNGKVFVRKDAQKINAFQSNGNVLLGENATINSKPELEIYADDVKCSHGSTTGQLDEEAIFYLRARGVSEKTARHMLISAFVGDVLAKINNDEVLDFVEANLESKFGFTFQ